MFKLKRIELNRITGWLLGAGLIACVPQAHSLADAVDAKTGVAVVELFTSEGCSSCPPAEAAVADLVRGAGGAKVLVLSFHVDYWDDLGWPDPFAQRAFTDRQREYQRAFKLDSVYTPQVVVNGGREFIGSNRAMLRDAVTEALGRPAAGTVSVKVGRTNASATIEATASGLEAGTIVRFALVQTRTASEVRAGENGGQTLVHRNVVRAFSSAPLGKDGRAAATLAAPKDGWPSEASVIVFAQRPADLRVLAAADVAFPK